MDLDWILKEIDNLTEKINIIIIIVNFEIILTDVE